ncbi:MAG TPA: hypothetical protein VN455_04890 [Methanotrichaceae archaeon]|nr:hypothetical protein [Methanotrichaceae archaeon]
MRCKLLALMISLALLILASPALGSMQKYPLWQYNVSLDLGDKNVTVAPQQTYSELNRVMRSTIFKGDDAYDWGGIYLFEQRQGTERESPADLLFGLMKNTCKAIMIDQGTISGQGGLIAKANARVEHGFGQQCWGGMVSISTDATGTDQLFAIVGHFSNESLNEQFVKTAKIDKI